MPLNFFITNFDKITLAIWLLFFSIVVIRYIRPQLIKNISYGLLAGIAALLHLLYGILATWGQYIVWGNSEFTKILLLSSLAQEVPFPFLLEWMRPFFSGAHGYFAFYSFQNFFLSTVALLVVTGLFYIFLVTRARYRAHNFREGDIMLILLAMLISGWPGIIVLLPIGLISAVILSIIARIFYGIERIPLAPAFLFSAPVALLLAVRILTALNLYPLLKL